jgi:lipopolysaccharide biosynthesis glycosyltransferase
MNDINIAFAVDSNNLDQVAIVIASILATTADPARLRFFIVVDAAHDAAENKINGWASRPPHLTIVPCRNAFGSRAALGHISTAALLRTQLPDVLPDLDRVLYLDADIVVRQDIAGLYQSELGGKPAGGILDIGMYLRLRRDKIRRDATLADYFLRLGLDPHQSQYVNSGVLLMDLEALRELGFSARALRFSNEHGASLITMDQCLINTILLGQIALLDPRWNVGGYLMGLPRHHHYVPRRLQRDLRLQAADPWLVHYTGKSKPWNAASVWHGEDWWAYAGRSGIAWPAVPASGKRPSRLKSAWRSVTWGFSYALSRVHPD